MNDLRFIPELRPTPLQWAQLKKAVSEGHKDRQFYMSLNGLLSAKSVKIVALVSDLEIISFAFYSFRNWVFNGNFYKSWSLGLVTTRQIYRGRGFSRKLIGNVIEAAIREKLDFLYLQGIPNFYLRFGFHGFAPKRKFIFDTTVFKEMKSRIIDINPNFHDQVKRIYRSYSHSIGSHVERSEEQWDDLYHSLSSTFLFYRPSLILNDNNDAIGYFCVSPTNPTQIREVAFLPNQKDVFWGCSALAKHIQRLGTTKMEIYAPNIGPIYEMCSSLVEGDFLCYLRPSSSNMVKQLSGRNLPRPLLESFILQGDNL